MRVGELRAFMKAFVDRTSLRHAREVTGVGYEAIRKFVDGDTRKPHPRSIHAFTSLYWRERGLVFVAEAGGSDPPVFWASELRAVFTGGKEEALAEAARIFALAGRHPDELPASAAELRRWLLRLIEAEYRKELPYRKPRRPGRGGGKAGGEPR